MSENIRVSEVSDILRKQLEGINTNVQLDEIGTVLQVSDGVVRIYGLRNAEANELLEFANCIKATGLPLVDMSGSDVARSCFLSYDPQAYINHKYKDDVEENIFRPRLGECPF